jgi:hypothetical protein
MILSLSLWHAFVFLGLGFFLFSSFCLAVAYTAFSCKKINILSLLVSAANFCSFLSCLQNAVCRGCWRGLPASPISRGRKKKQKLLDVVFPVDWNGLDYKKLFYKKNQWKPPNKKAKEGKTRQAEVRGTWRHETTSGVP